MSPLRNTTLRAFAYGLIAGTALTASAATLTACSSSHHERQPADTTPAHIIYASITRGGSVA